MFRRRQLAFYHQLHQLLRVGTPLPVLFAELQRAAGPGETREGLAKAAARLRAGAHLGDALAAAGPLVDPVTLELLRAAEETGTLERTLKARIDELEKMREIAQRALIAFLYPAYLALALVFIGPLLEIGPALQGSGAHPSIARVYFAGLLRMLLIIGSGVASLFVVPYLLSALGLRPAWDRLRTRLPLFGPLYRSLYQARLFSVLGGALEAGLEAGRSVRLAISATQSPAFAPRAAEIEGRVRQGLSLADALGELGLADSLTLGSVRIGEHAGQLPETLRRSAAEHWESAARRIRFAAAALLVLCVGGALVTIVVKILRVLLGTVLDAYLQLENLERR